MKLTLFERLRQLNKDGTDPPWRSEYDAGAETWPHFVVAPNFGRFRDSRRTVAECDGSLLGRDDAELIVECRNSLPAVLNLIEAAQEAESELRHRGVDDVAGWLARAVAVFVEQRNAPGVEGVSGLSSRQDVSPFLHG